jgi:hypothetical protein
MIIVWPLEDIVRMIPVKSCEQFWGYHPWYHLP